MFIPTSKNACALQWKKNDVYLNLVKIVCASTPPHVAQQRKCQLFRPRKCPPTHHPDGATWWQGGSHQCLSAMKRALAQEIRYNPLKWVISYVQASIWCHGRTPRFISCSFISHQLLIVPIHPFLAMDNFIQRC